MQGDFLERGILPLSQEHAKFELEQVHALIVRVISVKDWYTSEHSIIPRIKA
ncbi:hypothetical protein CHY_1024 [Carboxydothermus hydrogenoformans Z-2901]|uniref:Uncharacterized protein n=1 Tax=Carboxydothermus hydrogenoformans (strain ATCC BAA-161 / DSM 6008 / Z-2901) TaxID=246194 RepID=Q3ADB3_CARHZ|nr:hypothetical protein CHY_1024 [Carboxydothermus hydrogenoformans Z-2901]